MATIAPTFEKPQVHTFKLPQPSREGVKTTISPPFDIENTLTFDAIEYWAKVDPHRTALITTPKQWKCEHGKLAEKHDIDHEVEWTTVTYGEFWDKVQRIKAALHQAGIPNADASTGKPVRLLLLYAPTNRADVLALLIALQTTGCTLLFGNPEAFGGIRNFMETMLTLEPDFVIANKLVYTIFRGICMTLSKRIKKKPTWIKSTVLTKVAPKMTDKEIQQYASLRSSVTLESVTAIMFSSGTTGPPTPIEISQRMLSFQAAGYAQLLQKHLGEGVIRERTSITGQMGDDNNIVLMSKRDGPWTSTHVFVNFVMLDLVLGGTAVMQPMGLSCPDKTVDAPTLLAIWDKFQTQVTSAPPALWSRLLKLKQQQNIKPPPQDSLQLAFIGGAETSHTFAKSLAKEFFQSEGALESGCGLYRVYGTTQVLPIAMASDFDILKEESTHRLCARGYGVCLGRETDGLEVAIDTKVWEPKGGQSQLASYNTNSSNQTPLKLGELCTLGKAISPSMEIAGKPSPSKSAPTRIFRSGDIAYVDPATKYIYFLGRMAHAVDCGPQMLIPPVGVEMVCLETGVVDRCAFVGAPHAKTGTIVPTLVVQFEGEQANKEQAEAACRTIRTALENSVWAPVLQTELSLIAYSKTWPVDTRHSSKTNRFQLRDWAAKADQHKVFSI